MAEASPPNAIADVRRWLERTESRGHAAGGVLMCCPSASPISIAACLAEVFNAPTFIR